MALELTYDSQDAIAEPFRELYTERDGKFHLTGVTGMKTQADVDTVKEALRKEREDHKATADKLKPWGDLDHAETMAQLDRIKELELAAGGQLDEEKLSEMVEARLAQKTAPIQRDLEKVTAERDEAQGKVTELETTITRKEMGDQIRAAALEAKVHNTALSDIELVASTMMELDESGKLITKDGFGVTAGIDAATYFKEMQQSRPHWWPESEGGGARGGGGNFGYTGKNPWERDNWNLTEQGKVVQEHGTEVAAKMAKAAGTSVGGGIPKKKD